MTGVAGGYAIETHGEIDMTTVSPTERAAKVNWLVTACGILLPNNIEDDIIEAFWERASTEKGAHCVPVTVRKALQ
jgi:hypothetical protein